jgi:peptidoglycan/LPS O-acetylase OafA/YrhL
MEKRNHIELIDFIRGYSILTIVLYHYCQSIPLSPLLSKAINFGGTGIHTFLFASGFGLFLSHLRKPLSYTGFLKKRLSKIYIPYILIVSLTAVISLLVPIYENKWNNYFSHVFLYKMFDKHLIGTYGYQLWFISTIIQCYIFFPLIVKLRERMPGKMFLLTGLLISFAWCAVFLFLHKEEERNWYSFFLSYLWEFMLGMYCAEIYLKKGWAFWDVRKVWLLLIAFAGILIYSLMALWGGRYGKIYNDVPALFGYASVCILIYRLQWRGLNRFIFFTAKLSFLIFLIHFLILDLVRAACDRLGINWSWMMLVPTLILCYLAAMPLQKLFDHIIDALTNRQRRQATSASSSV